MVSGTPQGGVISPLLSNIYLHALDREWEKRGSTGRLIRYADDLVVLCKTPAQAVEAQKRVETILKELQLENNPAKTGRVDLREGLEEGFDFLGCHFQKVSYATTSTDGPLVLLR